MVTHNGIRINSLNGGFCHIIGINIANECKCRILCQLFLEFIVSFFPDCRVIRLTCLCQILVYQSIGIAGIVGTFVGSEYFVGMIICIKGLPQPMR